jgi:hypothetical protein
MFIETNARQRQELQRSEMLQGRIRLSNITLLRSWENSMEFAGYKRFVPPGLVANSRNL